MTRSEILHAAIKQELHNELCVDCAEALCWSIADICANGAADLEEAETAISIIAELARRYLRLSWDMVKAGMGDSEAVRQ